jgi:uncharacterized protein
MSRVVHFEIHATDPEKLVSFYTGLFGWTFQKWDGPMDYWLIGTGPADKPGINGGMIRRHGDAPTPMQAVNAFVCTVSVESAKSALDRAVELGGTMALPIMPVPGIGWLCYAKDPDDNIFGMMQPDPTAA